jgi:hypothetical protein
LEKRQTEQNEGQQWLGASSHLRWLLVLADHHRSVIEIIPGAEPRDKSNRTRTGKTSYY